MFNLALCLFTVAVLYKIVTNLFCFLSVNYYEKLYKKYLLRVSSDDESFDESPNGIIREIEGSTEKISDLFIRAGIEDFSLSIMQPAGYGFAVPQQISIFKNMTSLLTVTEINIPTTMLAFFVRSLGIYKSRIFQAFNPLYWIDNFVYLPQKIVSYLGYSMEIDKVKLIARILNLLYWGIFIFVTVMLYVFNIRILIY